MFLSWIKSRVVPARDCTAQSRNKQKFTPASSQDPLIGSSHPRECWDFGNSFLNQHPSASSGTSAARKFLCELLLWDPDNSPTTTSSGGCEDAINGILVAFSCQAPSCLILVATQHRTASPARRAGSAPSTARAPRRVCVRKDGFALQALCQTSTQVGILWDHSLPTGVSAARSV